MNKSLSVASYRSPVVLIVPPIFRMLSLIRWLLKYADSFWRTAQKADVKLAYVLEVKNKPF